MAEAIYRIRKLYRPVIGWRWWLQLGIWYESSGSVFTATGRGRRTFMVQFEEGYDTKEQAEKRLQEIQHGSPKAQGIRPVR